MVQWMDMVDISLQNIVKEVNSLEEFEKERAVFQVCVNALLIWYTWYLVLLGCHTWTHDCWGHKLLVAVCGYDLQVLTQWKEGVGGVASWFDPHEQYFRCRKFNIKFSITFHGHKWRL